MTTTRAMAIVLVMLGLVTVVMAIAVSNYRECRKADFSRLYCASSHLVR